MFYSCCRCCLRLDQIKRNNNNHKLTDKDKKSNTNRPTRPARRATKWYSSTQLCDVSKFRRMFFHRHLLENTRRWTRMDCEKNTRLSACIWSRSGTCVWVSACVRCIVKLLLIPWKMLLLNSLIHFLWVRISQYLWETGKAQANHLFLLSFWCVIFGLKSYSPPYYHHKPPPPGQECSFIT